MDDDHVIGALVGIANSVGFFPRHSILMSIYQQFMKGRKLSDRQIAVVRKLVRKYKRKAYPPISNHYTKHKITVYRNAYIEIQKSKLLNSTKILKDKFGFKFIVVNQDMWRVPLNYWNIEAVIKNKDSFVWDDKFQVIIDTYFNYKEIKEIKYEGLRPYQNEGVGFIRSRGGNCLLADDMGLGKTIQAIEWMKVNAKYPVLIVCPSSVKYNWQREIKKWTGGIDAWVLSGRSSETLNRLTKIFIINYDIMEAWQKVLLKNKFQMCITDEAHNLKNKKAAKTKATYKVLKEIPKRLFLTGTPIENSPKELYQLIKFINPYLFPKWTDFGKTFCDPKETPWGTKYDGVSNMQELHRILNETIMIRRMKKDVAKDLPRKQNIIIPMALSNTNEYEKSMRDFKKWENDLRKILITGNDEEVKKAKASLSARRMVMDTMVRKGVTMAKIDECCKWIDEFLMSGRKLVVFAWHTDVIKYIAKVFKGECVTYTGSTSAKDREEIVLEFQNDPECLLFIGNLKAAGVGINLTAASDMAIIELPWSPMILNQAKDRIHRIGQNRACTYYYLMATNTIEMHMAEILDGKRTVIEGVVDGTVPSKNEMFNELMKRI